MKTEGEVIDIPKPGASLELTDEARATVTFLTESMYPVCFIHNLDLCDLVEKHEGDYGEFLVEAADLVVTDALYNIGLVCADGQSNQDKYLAEDMKAIRSSCREVIKPSSHGHRFCTALQFVSWHKLFVKEVERMDDGGTSCSDSKQMSKR